jgi:hypothetical protein
MSKYDQHLYDEWSPKNTTLLDDSFTSKKVWWECQKVTHTMQQYMKGRIAREVAHIVAEEDLLKALMTYRLCVLK